MRARCGIVPLSLIALLSFACQQAADVSETRPAATLDRLDQLRDEHVDAIVEGSVEKEIATYSDSAVLIPPGQPTITGTEEIRAWLEGFFASFSVERMELSLAEQRIQGDQAVVHYRYSWSVAPVGSEAVPDTGEGLWVLERGTDGRWLIVYDIWNSDGGAGGG